MSATIYVGRWWLKSIRVSKMVSILLNMMLVVWVVVSSPMPLMMTEILLTTRIVASQLMMILITTRMIKLPVQERDRMKMRVIMNVVLMKVKMMMLLLMIMLIVEMPHRRGIDISMPRLKMTTLAHDGKKGRKLAGGRVSLAFLTWDCRWWNGDRGGHRGVEEKENTGWSLEQGVDIRAQDLA